MTFATAMTAIGTHLTASGAAVTPTIVDVARGAPVSVPARLVRYWWAGTAEPPHYPGGTTLGTRMIGQRITVGLYIPVSDKAVLAGVDAELQAFQAQVFTRLLSDCELGGACDDLTVGDAEVDYPVVNGQQVAELTIPITLDFGEAYTITP